MDIDKMNNPFTTYPAYNQQEMFRVPLVTRMYPREQFINPAIRAPYANPQLSYPPANFSYYREKKEIEPDFLSYDSNIDLLPSNLGRMHEEEMNKLNVIISA
jgi:hypothetical protein